MGSIVAVLSRSGPADTQAVRRMLAAAPHRGPAVDLCTSGNAIVGTSNPLDAVDSVLSTAGEFVAALSGRLDNAPELACELTKAGFPPASNSGADVLIVRLSGLWPGGA